MKVINVNGKDYALKLTIGSIKNLEKRLGKNPLNFFVTNGDLPEITPMSIMFHAALTTMNHGITEEDSDKILDDWCNEYVPKDKNDMAFTGLFNLILEVFQDAGFVPKTQEKEKQTSKNK